MLVALAAVAMGASRLPGPAGATNNGSDPLVFGLLPFASPGTLFKRFGPLRDYLETRVDRPVRLATAPDFPTFVKRTERGRYAILLTAPHFTLMALDSGRYEVRATYTQRLSAVILGRSDDSRSGPGDSRCRKVATPPRSAIITLMGKRFMGQRYPKADLTYQTYASHNAAVRAVLGGDACLAVASVNVWNRMRSEEPDLARLTQTASIPALGILFRKDLPSSLRHRITEAMVNMQDHPQGQQALREMAYPGYQRAEAADFEPVRTYLEQLPDGWLKGPGTP
ncbi:MAG: phosphate/phosphite/phosphonate ABC transporter substrate-binding protein [Thiohalorhabdaceae bacterium]